MNFYKISEFANRLNITPQTLRNWEKEGILLPHHKTEYGYRYYSHEQLEECLGKKRLKRAIGYCKVINSEDEDALKCAIRTLELYLKGKGYDFEILIETENDSVVGQKNTALKRITNLIVKNQISLIVALGEQEDLANSFKGIEEIGKIYDCVVEVLDTTQLNGGETKVV